MYFILDLIAILIIVSAVISCYKNGFFKSFFGTMKVVIAIIVSYIFMPTVAYFYRTSFVEKAISDTVAERIHSFTEKTLSGFNLEKLFSNMPTEFSDILSRYGADAESLSERFGTMADATSSNVADLAESITAPIVRTVSDVLAFATLFVGCLIILSIVIWIMGMILKLPVLSGIDKGLGLIFGVISGLLMLWVYCNLVYFALDAISTIKPGVLGSNVIENTYIVKYISDNFLFGFAATNP